MGTQGVTRPWQADGEGPELSSARPVITLADGRADAMERADGQVFGTYLHGLFDNEALTGSLLGRLAENKGITLGTRTESAAEIGRAHV